MEKNGKNVPKSQICKLNTVFLNKDYRNQYLFSCSSLMLFLEWINCILLFWILLFSVILSTNLIAELSKCMKTMLLFTHYFNLS